MNFYEEVAERVRIILKGGENFYNHNVERNNLLKREKEEPGEEPKEEPGEEPGEEPKENPNLHIDEDLLKLQELTKKMFKKKD